MTESLELLHKAAYLVLDLDDTGEFNKFEVDEEDVMNAVHVFWSVIANKQACISLKQGDGVKRASEKAVAMAEELNAFILKYTGVDTKTYYHEQPTTPNPPQPPVEGGE